MRFSILLATLATTASAHEFTEIETTGFRDVGPITVIDMANTVSGYRVACGLYDENGKLLASTATYTDNLATQALISGNFPEAKSAACAIAD